MLDVHPRARSSWRRAGAVLASSAVALGFAAVHGAIPAAAATTTWSQLSYTSPQGAGVGSGATAVFSSATASFSESGQPSLFRIAVTEGQENWAVQFGGANGQPLTPGTYQFDNAIGGTGSPSFEFGGDGSGCGGWGWFTIRAISTAPGGPVSAGGVSVNPGGGNVTMLDATFSETCIYNGPAVTGSIQFGIPTSVSFSEATDQSSAGQPVLYSVAVDGGNNGPATGTVTLSDGTASLGSVQLDPSGTASVELALPAGVHEVVASYAGDGAHPAARSALLPSTVAPTSSTTAYSYTSATGDFVGEGQSGSYAAPTDSFSLAGTLGNAHVSLPQAGWYLDFSAPKGAQLTPGTYSNVATYPPVNGGAAGLSVSGNHHGCDQVYGWFTVNSIASAPTGSLIELDVTFEQHCESPTAPPLDGHVQVGVSTSSVPSVSLTASSSMVNASTPVTFTGHVASSTGGVGGSLTFADGDSTLGTVPLDASGTAALTTTLALGMHNVTVLYAGDILDPPNSSVPVSVASRWDTGTGLVAVPSTLPAPGAVTLTAQVTSASGQTPTGTVTFWDGHTTVGTAALNNGVAVLVDTTAGAGTHAMSAVYSGDSWNLPSTSNTAMVVVG